MKKKKNILIITGWSFKDALIQVYTLPYVRMIRKIIPVDYNIIFVTLEQPAQRLDAQEKSQKKQTLHEEGITWLPLTYHRFGLTGMALWFINLVKLCILVISKRIDCIHAWCMPAGALGYFLSRISRRPLIVDSYEPHAEAMVENNTWRRNSFRFRILFGLEKKLSQHASICIAPTASMKNYALEKYGTRPANFFVKPACVDLEYFAGFQKKDPALLKELGLENKVVCLYTGKFGGIYLTQDVFDFFKAAFDHWGTRLKILLLTNHAERELRTWASISGIDWNDIVVRFVATAQIPRYTGLADFAITPVKPVPTKKYCTPIKDGEYWAMGLPVVITKDISDDSDIIEKNNAGYVLQSLTQEEYSKAVKKIDSLLAPENRMSTEQKILNLALSYRNFSIARNIYLEVYTKLIPLYPLSDYPHLPQP